mmetsp:Transcript_14920/g.62917  ORF Transcript_14920/g.62917 Transcript_14920/m.62917 type:complete len:222 (-) Transcript_14920:934-1599(-)
MEFPGCLLACDELDRAPELLRYDTRFAAPTPRALPYAACLIVLLGRVLFVQLAPQQPLLPLVLAQQVWNLVYLTRVVLRVEGAQAHAPLRLRRVQRPVPAAGHLGEGEEVVHDAEDRGQGEEQEEEEVQGVDPEDEPLLLSLLELALIDLLLAPLARGGAAHGAVALRHLALPVRGLRSARRRPRKTEATRPASTRVTTAPARVGLVTRGSGKSAPRIVLA